VRLVFGGKLIAGDHQIVVSPLESALDAQFVQASVGQML